jgi:nucleoside-diphosphate-sugar epimerase
VVRLADARVLLTGAPGFIGSHLTRKLVTEGADVHVLSPSVSTVYPSRLLDLRGKITLHEGHERLDSAPRHSLTEGLAKTIEWYTVELANAESAFDI